MKVIIATADENIIASVKQNSFFRQRKKIQLFILKNVSECMSMLSLEQVDIVLFSKDICPMDTTNFSNLCMEKNPGVNVGLIDADLQIEEVRSLYLSGVNAFILPSEIPSLIESCILAITNKGIFFSNQIMKELLGFHVAIESNPFHRLTRRQLEIAGLFLKGMRSVDICHKLNLKSSTVATQKNKILGKLGITAFAQLDGYKSQKVRALHPKKLQHNIAI